MLNFFLFKEIGITKFKDIKKIILFYLRNKIRINYLKIMKDNIKVYDLVCNNISMIDLTENKIIKEFKTKIIKTVINLTQNHIKNHIKKLCDYEEFDITIKLLINIKSFLEILG